MDRKSRGYALLGPGAVNGQKAANQPYQYNQANFRVALAISLPIGIRWGQRASAGL
jgi:hypothetical protein